MGRLRHAVDRISDLEAYVKTLSASQLATISDSVMNDLECIDELEAIVKTKAMESILQEGLSHLKDLHLTRPSGCLHPNKPVASIVNSLGIKSLGRYLVVTAYSYPGITVYYHNEYEMFFSTKTLNGKKLYSGLLVASSGATVEGANVDSLANRLLSKDLSQFVICSNVIMVEHEGIYNLCKSRYSFGDVHRISRMKEIGEWEVLPHDSDLSMW